MAESFELRLAADARDLAAAQRLRYAVFVEEMGSDGPLVDHAARLERDAFDDICDHLLLIDRNRELTEQLEQLHTENEALRSRLLELGTRPPAKQEARRGEHADNPSATGPQQPR